jgi:hypothetical protein
VTGMRRTKLPCSREQLVHLLTEAAEFEHNLLCCYLYAAFSLKPGACLAADEAAVVARWRGTIMGVAIEEMAHLALVANITVAVGARPHFNRPNFPVPPGYHPAGMVVQLAPFCRETLDHFIFIERSAEKHVQDGEGFEADSPYQRDQPLRGLMPGAFDYRTIAEFYEGIRQELRLLAAEFGERAVFVGSPGRQLSSGTIDLAGLHAVSDLASALRAIDTIVEQGEGSPQDSGASHFSRFVQVRDELEAMQRARPGFEPAWPCARNPVMRKPVEDEGRVHVDAPQAALVLDLANALYNQMLRLLTQSFGRTNADAGEASLMPAATELMKIFGAVGTELSSLDASTSAPGIKAGVSFAMLRHTEPLGEGGSEMRLLAERLDELADGLRSASAVVPGLLPQIARLQRLTASLVASPA